MPAWKVEAPGLTVAAFVRAQTGEPWSQVKRWIERGKVFVDGERSVAIDRRLAPGQAVELHLAAPAPRDPQREAELVYDDAHLVVIDKPSGISSVPFEARETDTAMDLIRRAWRRKGLAASEIALHVVHRIDRATSGLLLFAKTKAAERGLGAQLRDHTMERTYLCLAHGSVRGGTTTSYLVADRGDGLRGSTAHPGQGKRAVTHVQPLETIRQTTWLEVRLETGRTHQIRIHLAEAGHPLVGEKVYVRDFARAGGVPLSAPRLMLHAATLGFSHPITGERHHFSAPLPADIDEFLAGLRRRAVQAAPRARR